MHDRTMIFDLKVESMILCGMIGKNNSIYWESKTVGHALEYNINYFTGKYSTNTLKEVAPNFWKNKFAIKDLNMKVIKNVTFLACLKENKKKKSHYPFLYELLQDFDFFVTVNRKEMYFPVATMCLERVENSVKFCEWLEVYRREIMTICDSPPPSPLPALPSTTESSITESESTQPPSPSHVSSSTPSSPTTASGNACQCSRQHACRCNETFQPADSVPSPQQPSASTGSASQVTTAHRDDRCSPETFKKMKEAFNSSVPFHFWLDAVPPNKVIIFCGNQAKTFVPKY